jgi:hypothetical protein
VQTHRVTQAQVEAQQPLEVGDAVDEELSRLRLLLARLEAAPRDQLVATQLNHAIVALAKRPSRAVLELLRELAGLPLLRSAKDARDWPCRAAVIATWLELGYPWALEVTPEDLEYVRSHLPGNVTGWLNLTFMLGVVAAFQNFGVAMLAVVAVLLNPIPAAWLVMTVPPVLAGLHAWALVRSSRLGLSGAPVADRLRRLTRIEWSFPLVLALVASPDWSTRLAVLIWCAPQLLSWSAGRLAARLDKPTA